MRVRRRETERVKDVAKDIEKNIVEEIEKQKREKIRWGEAEEGRRPIINNESEVKSIMFSALFSISQSVFQQ